MEMTLIKGGMPWGEAYKKAPFKILTTSAQLYLIKLLGWNTSKVLLIIMEKVYPEDLDYICPSPIV